MVTGWSTASVKITQWSENSEAERALSSYHCGLGSNSRSNVRSRLTLLMAPPFSDGLSPCSPVFLIPQPFKFSFHINARVRELFCVLWVHYNNGRRLSMRWNVPKFSKKRTTLRGIPEFLEISYRNFPLHLTYLREFTFKFFRQSSEFLDTFPASFRSICLHYEFFGIFGWMASARRSHLSYRQQRLAVVGGKCQKSISLGRRVTQI